MELATPPTSTGNPGQPRDPQFCGPFLEMFFRQSAVEGPAVQLPFMVLARAEEAYAGAA